MKHTILTLGLAILFTGSLFAQEKRTIKVIVPNKTDEIFITGNQDALGDWNPGSVKMTKTSDFEREITVDLNYPAEFKFTKGDWNSEGIIERLDNNPNLKIADQNSRTIFMVKGWSNESDGKALGLDYNIKHFQSEYLGAERLIKIVLPENYDPSKKYPVFYTTDAGWNIFGVAKDFISNASKDEYKLAPEAILVGIVHGMTNGESNRNKDLDVYYGKTGQNFKNFVFKELVPYIDNTYSTSNFNVMIGHSNGAEYNHFLLLEEENPFRGFISFSTNFFSKDVRQEMGDFMKNYQGKNMYYFVANATADSPDRIEAGDDYEKIYNANKNEKFNFNKITYKADHNSVVPLAFLDGIQFIFKDYRNFDNYPTFAAYKDNYPKDLSTNYGLEEKYRINDLDSFLMDIITRKNKEDLDTFLQFVKEHKLWHVPPYMKEPGGLDPVNKGNFYFLIDEYEESANNYELASENLGSSTMPDVYFGNLPKTVSAFQKLGDYDRLMNLLLRSKSYLGIDTVISEKRKDYNLLYVNYHIAKLSKEQGINQPEGKQALAYCTENYKKNSDFTEEDLQELQ